MGKDKNASLVSVGTGRYVLSELSDKGAGEQGWEEDYMPMGRELPWKGHA